MYLSSLIPNFLVILSILTPADKFVWSVEQQDKAGLFPVVLNLASVAKIWSNATCGENGAETYCKIMEHVEKKPYDWILNKQCDICDAKSDNPDQQHPIENAIDGTRKWWQSPSIARGYHYHTVDIIIDLRQIYQIFYMIIRAGPSPRPGNWILERSLDGIDFKPWQFFATSVSDCNELMRDYYAGRGLDDNEITAAHEMIALQTGDSSFHYARDDQVTCTTQFSELMPLEDGEIHISLVNGRPGSINGPGKTLMDFTSARYIRLKLRKIRTLHADFITYGNNRIYKEPNDYSLPLPNINDNVNSDSYFNFEETPNFDDLKNNKNGTYKRRTKPGKKITPREAYERYEQNYYSSFSSDQTVSRRYYYSIRDISIGGQCICYGHANLCLMDPKTGQKQCKCEHNTCGESCDKCCPLFNQRQWLPAARDSKFVCEACNCHNHSSECVYDANVDKYNQSLNARGIYRGGGVCLNCKDNTEGINCERCRDGYYHPENMTMAHAQACLPCQCIGHGVINPSCLKEIDRRNRFAHYTDMQPGDCFCKPNYAGRKCERCAKGYRNYPHCTPCPCNIEGMENPDDCEGNLCKCKKNVRGKYCERCAEGHYGLHASNARGCERCFCFGLSNNCTGLPWVVTKVSNMRGWSLTEESGRIHVPIPSLEKVFSNINNGHIGDQNINGIFPYSKEEEKSLKAANSILSVTRSQLESLMMSAPTQPIVITKINARINVVNGIVKNGGPNGKRITNQFDDYYWSAPNDNYLVAYRLYYSKGLHLRFDITYYITETAYSNLTTNHKQIIKNEPHRTPLIIVENENGMKIGYYPDHIHDIDKRYTQNDDRRSGYKTRYNVKIDHRKGWFLLASYNKKMPGEEKYVRQQLSFKTFATVLAGAKRLLVRTQYHPAQSLAYLQNFQLEYAAPPLASSNALPSFVNYNSNNNSRPNGVMMNHIAKRNHRIHYVEQCACDQYQHNQQINQKSENSQKNNIDINIKDGKHLINNYYAGLSCQTCQGGFRRVNNVMYRGTCAPCDCNGHSESCDSFSGKCTLCKHNTHGPRCESCRPGFFANPYRYNVCMPCECPFPSSPSSMSSINSSPQNLENDHYSSSPSHGGLCVHITQQQQQQQQQPSLDRRSTRASLIEGNGTDVAIEMVDRHNMDDFVCTACPPGHTGSRCQSCLPGWFGDPLRDRSFCKRCDCNGNGLQETIPTFEASRQNAVEVCDKNGGICTKCYKYTQGTHCELCKPGYYGWKPGYGCKACDCNAMGSDSPNCDSVTGQCLCKPRYVGLKCGMCQIGYGDVSAGCPACRCHNLGTLSTTSTTNSQNLPKTSLVTNSLCDQTTGSCNCKPGVTGKWCDSCLPGYYGLSAHGCDYCRCDERGSNDTHCDVRTGQCSCLPNIEGRTCDQCTHGHWGMHLTNVETGEGCQSCNCSTLGSETLQCTQDTGECACKYGVEGMYCNKCEPGFYGEFTKINADRTLRHNSPNNKTLTNNYNNNNPCKRCQRCASQFYVCDSRTGQCKCPPNTMGERCDKCTPYTWLFDRVKGCRACDCNPIGSRFLNCSTTNGRCTCRPGYTGPHCDTCNRGYYDFPRCRKCRCDYEKGGTQADSCKVIATFGKRGLSSNKNLPIYSVFNVYNRDYHKLLALSSTLAKSNTGRKYKRNYNNENDFYGGIRSSERTEAFCDCSNDGQCLCKKNVRGKTCNRCKTSTFGLFPEKLEGCTPCFCFGRGKSCELAPYNIDQITISPENIWAQVDSTRPSKLKRRGQSNHGSNYIMSNIDFGIAPNRITAIFDANSRSVFNRTVGSVQADHHFLRNIHDNLDYFNYIDQQRTYVNDYKDIHRDGEAGKKQGVYFDGTRLQPTNSQENKVPLEVPRKSSSPPFDKSLRSDNFIDNDDANINMVMRKKRAAAFEEERRISVLANRQNTRDQLFTVDLQHHIGSTGQENKNDDQEMAILTLRPPVKGQTFYWNLPSQFLGDRVLSYGSNLTFVLTTFPILPDLRHPTYYQEPLVQLKGGNGKLTLLYYPILPDDNGNLVDDTIETTSGNYGSENLRNSARFKEPLDKNRTFTTSHRSPSPSSYYYNALRGDLKSQLHNKGGDSVNALINFVFKTNDALDDWQIRRFKRAHLQPKRRGSKSKRNTVLNPDLNGDYIGHERGGGLKFTVPFLPSRHWRWSQDPNTPVNRELLMLALQQVQQFAVRGNFETASTTSSEDPLELASISHVSMGTGVLAGQNNWGKPLPPAMHIELCRCASTAYSGTSCQNPGTGFYREYSDAILANNDDIVSSLNTDGNVQIINQQHQNDDQTHTKRGDIDRSDTDRWINSIVGQSAVCDCSGYGGGFDLSYTTIGKESKRLNTSSHDLNDQQPKAHIWTRLEGEELCDRETGVCLNCLENSAGPHCESCARGFYSVDITKKQQRNRNSRSNGNNAYDVEPESYDGLISRDLTSKRRHMCIPCACPLSIPSNNFSPTCKRRRYIDVSSPGQGNENNQHSAYLSFHDPTYKQLNHHLFAMSNNENTSKEDNYGRERSVEAQEELICDACMPGYTGDRCQFCAPGFYGSPSLIGGMCQSCKCSLPGSADNLCHNVTGYCNCLPGITGPLCDTCALKGYVISLEVNAAYNGGMGKCISCYEGCTTALMWDIDSLEDILSNKNFTKIYPLPWGRLNVIANKTNDFKDHLALALKGDTAAIIPNFNKLIVGLNNQEILMNKLQSKHLELKNGMNKTMKNFQSHINITSEVNNDIRASHNDMINLLNTLSVFTARIAGRLGQEDYFANYHQLDSPNLQQDPNSQNETEVFTENANSLMANVTHELNLDPHLEAVAQEIFKANEFDYQVRDTINKRHDDNNNGQNNVSAALDSLKDKLIELKEGYIEGERNLSIKQADNWLKNAMAGGDINEASLKQLKVNIMAIQNALNDSQKAMEDIGKNLNNTEAVQDEYLSTLRLFNEMMDNSSVTLISLENKSPYLQMVTAAIESSPEDKASVHTEWIGPSLNHALELEAQAKNLTAILEPAQTRYIRPIAALNQLKSIYPTVQNDSANSANLTSSETLIRDVINHMANYSTILANLSYQAQVVETRANLFNTVNFTDALKDIGELHRVINVSHEGIDRAEQQLAMLKREEQETVPDSTPVLLKATDILAKTQNLNVKITDLKNRIDDELKENFSRVATLSSDKSVRAISDQLFQTRTNVSLIERRADSLEGKFTDLDDHRLDLEDSINALMDKIQMAKQTASTIRVSVQSPTGNCQRSFKARDNLSPRTVNEISLAFKPITTNFARGHTVQRNHRQTNDGLTNTAGKKHILTVFNPVKTISGFNESPLKNSLASPDFLALYYEPDNQGQLRFEWKIGDIYNNETQTRLDDLWIGSHEWYLIKAKRIGNKGTLEVRKSPPQSLIYVEENSSEPKEVPAAGSAQKLISYPRAGDEGYENDGTNLENQILTPPSKTEYSFPIFNAGRETLVIVGGFYQQPYKILDQTDNNYGNQKRVLNLTNMRNAPVTNLDGQSKQGNNEGLPGCMSELSIDGVKFGLWNFDSQQGGCLGCLESPKESREDLTYQFSGHSSYAKVPQITRYNDKRYSINLQFKTYLQNALLFFTHNDNNQFFSIELKNGRVLFKFCLDGKNVATMKTAQLYNNGEWIYLSAERLNYRGHLKVNNEIVEGTAPPYGTQELEFADSHLYFGGLEPGIITALQDKYKPELMDLSKQSSTYFMGCMRLIQIGQTSIELFEGQIYGLEAGCVSKEIYAINFLGSGFSEYRIHKKRDISTVSSPINQFSQNFSTFNDADITDIKALSLTFASPNANGLILLLVFKDETSSAQINHADAQVSSQTLSAGAPQFINTQNTFISIHLIDGQIYIQVGNRKIDRLLTLTTKNTNALQSVKEKRYDDGINHVINLFKLDYNLTLFIDDVYITSLEILNALVNPRGVASYFPPGVPSDPENTSNIKGQDSQNLIGHADKDILFYNLNPFATDHLDFDNPDLSILRITSFLPASSIQKPFQTSTYHGGSGILPNIEDIVKKVDSVPIKGYMSLGGLPPDAYNILYGSSTIAPYLKPFKGCLSDVVLNNELVSLHNPTRFESIDFNTCQFYASQHAPESSHLSPPDGEISAGNIPPPPPFSPPLLPPDQKNLLISGILQATSNETLATPDTAHIKGDLDYNGELDKEVYQGELDDKNEDDDEMFFSTQPPPPPPPPPPFMSNTHFITRGNNAPPEGQTSGTDDATDRHSSRGYDSDAAHHHNQSTRDQLIDELSAKRLQLISAKKNAQTSSPLSSASEGGRSSHFTERSNERMANLTMTSSCAPLIKNHSIDPDAVSFGESSNSHAKFEFNQNVMRRKLDISLEFRTFYSDGLLVYLKDREQTEYLAIQLRDSRLQIVYYTMGDKEILSPAGLNDGKWHHIRIKKERRSLIVKLDDYDEIRAPIVKLLNVIPPGYIGGIPESYIPRPNVKTQSFKGCIRNLMINRRSYDIFQSESFVGITQCFANVETGAHFTGDSYAIFEKNFNVGSEMEILLKFRTTQKNGVLVSIGEKEGYPSLGLALYEGQVVFSVNMGEGLGPFKAVKRFDSQTLIVNAQNEGNTASKQAQLNDGPFEETFNRESKRAIDLVQGSNNPNQASNLPISAPLLSTESERSKNSGSPPGRGIAITNENYICDNKWHTVIAAYVKNIVTLKVDNFDIEFGFDEGNLQETKTNNYLYIGGYPDEMKKNQGSVPTHQKFIGCMKFVTIKKNKKDWENMYSLHNLNNNCPISKLP